MLIQYPASQRNWWWWNKPHYPTARTAKIPACTGHRRHFPIALTLDFLKNAKMGRLATNGVWGSINGGTPNWWFIMRNPIRLDDLGIFRGTPFLGNFHFTISPSDTGCTPIEESPWHTVNFRLPKFSKILGRPLHPQSLLRFPTYVLESPDRPVAGKWFAGGLYLPPLSLSHPAVGCYPPLLAKAATS